VSAIVVFDTDTALGRLRGAATGDGLALLALPGGDFETPLTRLAGRGSVRRGRHPAAAELRAWCAGRRRDCDIPLDLRLVSGFTRAVLDALRAVPFGALVTYGELAARAGRPRAARAVGRAVGANPLPIVVPCHRVIAAGGRLGGFGGGLPLKIALLAIEGHTVVARGDRAGPDARVPGHAAPRAAAVRRT